LFAAGASTSDTDFRQALDAFTTSASAELSQYLGDRVRAMPADSGGINVSRRCSSPPPPPSHRNSSIISSCTLRPADGRRQRTACSSHATPRSPAHPRPFLMQLRRTSGVFSGPSLASIPTLFCTHPRPFSRSLYPTHFRPKLQPLFSAIFQPFQAHSTHFTIFRRTQHRAIRSPKAPADPDPRPPVFQS